MNAPQERRLRNWRSSLAALMSERSSAPFAWGANDCCLFAADCVKAVTGRDPAHGLRGQYRSANGATRILARFGGVRGVAASRLGPEISPRSAQIGDIVLVQHHGRDSLAVCGGTHLIAPGPDRSEPIPISSGIAAWRCVGGHETERSVSDAQHTASQSRRAVIRLKRKV